MRNSNVPIASFTISDEAKRGIGLTREWFNSHWPDPAAVPTIGWARYEPKDGEPFENVAVTFYSQSQLAEIASAIQVVSGIKVVFLPAPSDIAKFDGMVLDYSDERGFFLRLP